MSNKDTVEIIDKLRKYCLIEVFESIKTGKFYPEKIDIYNRKGLEGKPKDLLLGI